MTNAERAAALAKKLSTSGLAWTYKQIHPVDWDDVRLIARLLEERADPSPASADLREADWGVHVSKAGTTIGSVPKEFPFADPPALFGGGRSCVETLPREPTEDQVTRAIRTACCARPVGGGDGDTYEVRVPTQDSMRAALVEYAALASKETSK